MIAARSVVLAASLAALVTACGRDREPSHQPAPSTAAGPAGAAPAAPAPTAPAPTTTPPTPPTPAPPTPTPAPAPADGLGPAGGAGSGTIGTGQAGTLGAGSGSDSAAPARERAAAKEAARQDAVRNAGILGRAQLEQGGAFASLTGTGDISSGFDDVDIQGGLLGGQAGTGTGWGTIGTGRYGTIGTGRYGTIGGGRSGSGGVGTGGGGGPAPSVRIGQPDVIGALDKAIVRRYIKRWIRKISYCYEKELLARPGLEGTMVTRFTIAPSGVVTASTAGGVDPAVATCVAGVIKAIEFPKPKDGAPVEVSYPFTFRPTGGGY